MQYSRDIKPVLSSRNAHGFTFISIKGKIYQNDCREIEDFVINKTGDDSLGTVINLAEVPFIVSSFLSTLFKLNEQMAKRRKKMIILSPSDEAKELFSRVDVTHFFQIIQSEASLVQHIQKHDLDDILESDGD